MNHLTGPLDDLTCEDVTMFRLERLSAGTLWLCLYHTDGTRSVLDIVGPRVRIVVAEDAEPTVPK